MNAAELGETIRRRRALLRIEQTTLAQLAGVSVHTVSNLETGKGNPTLSVIAAVLSVLGLELVTQVTKVSAHE